FRQQFPVTPPTAFSVLSDVQNNGHKTVWFNSRFYRANLLWKNETFRFRDIHLFDERFQSAYLDKAGTQHNVSTIRCRLWTAAFGVNRKIRRGCGLYNRMTPENQEICRWEILL
ncbi:MAG: hypothetical protein LBQ54_01135, partial [Planctomycetaceae bacterium]|nr:hypothetical protein [Planctomycetaceae bacterium]